MIKNEYIEAIISDSINLEGIKDAKGQQKYRRQFIEPLDVVNDDGVVIGQAPRGLCHRLGLRHRTIYVFIVRNDGRILLQQRGGGIDANLARLDVAVGGHVKAGETDLVLSACREMQEELGVSPHRDSMTLIAEYNRDAPPTLIKPLERNRERRYLYKYLLTERETHEIDKLFRSRRDKEEVTAIAWFASEEALNAINSGRVADGLFTSLLYYLSAQNAEYYNRPQ